MTTRTKLTRLSLLAACVLAVFLACIPDQGSPVVEAEDAAVADAAPDADPGGIDASGALDANLPLIAEGYAVFHTVDVPPFGAVGCAHCHCDDASGGCNFSAPNVQGKSRNSIANALQTVPEMEPVDLTEHEIDAVAAWLATLVM